MEGKVYFEGRLEEERLLSSGLGLGESTVYSLRRPWIWALTVQENAVWTNQCSGDLPEANRCTIRPRDGTKVSF